MNAEEFERPEPENDIDWDEIVGDFAIVANYFREARNIDELAALANIWDVILMPVLRAIPLEVWRDANMLRHVFHEQTKDMQETVH